MRALPSLPSLWDRFRADLRDEVVLVGDAAARWRDRFRPLTEASGAPPSPPEPPGGGLFRAEALAARRDVWLGEAQLVQPLPVTLVSAVSGLLAGALLLLLIFGVYTRRVHADGILAPPARCASSSPISHGCGCPACCIGGSTISSCCRRSVGAGS